jgi:hypothetical protein
MKKKYWVMIILAVLFTGFVLMVGLAWAAGSVVHRFTASQTQTALEEQKILADISERTGVKPDWQAIRTYIYCYLLRPGASRTDVEAGLSKIGDFVSTGDMDLYRVDFKNNYLNQKLSPIKIYFENDYVITSGEGEIYWGANVDCDLKQANIVHTINMAH